MAIVPNQVMQSSLTTSFASLITFTTSLTAVTTTKLGSKAIHSLLTASAASTSAFAASVPFRDSPRVPDQVQVAARVVPVALELDS